LLLKQPDNPYPVVERVTVKVGKAPYIRFDQNDYSVPHTHVRRALTVLAEVDQLRVVEGQVILATHRRSYDRGEQIEHQVHVQALVEDDGPAMSSSGSGSTSTKPSSVAFH
jgi:hypothetical protein